MPSAHALGILSGKSIFYFAFVAAPTLVRAKPFHLLSQIARLLERPTGAFIAAQPRSFRSYFFTGKVVKANGICCCRLIAVAQRLKTGGTQKILSLCAESRSFLIIVTHPSKVNRPPCPAAAPPPAGPAAHGCRKQSAHCSRFAPPRCRAAPSAPAPGQRPHPAP